MTVIISLDDSTSAPSAHLFISSFKKYLLSIYIMFILVWWTFSFMGKIGNNHTEYVSTYNWI